MRERATTVSKVAISIAEDLGLSVPKKAARDMGRRQSGRGRAERERYGFWGEGIFEILSKVRRGQRGGWERTGQNAAGGRSGARPVGSGGVCGN